MSLSHNEAVSLMQRTLEENPFLALPFTAGFSAPVVRRLMEWTGITTLHMNIYGLFSEALPTASAAVDFAYFDYESDTTTDSNPPDAPLSLAIAEYNMDVFYRTYVLAESEGRLGGCPWPGIPGYTGTVVAESQFPVAGAESLPAATRRALVEIGHQCWAAGDDETEDRLRIAGGIYGPRFSAVLAGVPQATLLAMFERWHEFVREEDTDEFRNLGKAKTALLCTTAELIHTHLDLPLDPDLIWGTLLLADSEEMRATVKTDTALARVLHYSHQRPLEGPDLPEDILAALRQVGIEPGPEAEAELDVRLLMQIGCDGEDGGTEDESTDEVGPVIHSSVAGREGPPFAPAYLPLEPVREQGDNNA